MLLLVFVGLEPGDGIWASQHELTSEVLVESDQLKLKEDLGMNLIECLFKKSI